MRPLFLAVVLVIGCSEPKPIESLVAADRWTPVPLEADPYAEHHAGASACPAVAFGVEELGTDSSFFIDVRDCAYLTVEQTTLVEVEEGDPMRLRLWHFALDALRETATATIVMTVAGSTVLDATIPIPSESELLAPAWVAGFDAPAGSRAVFHLRNHGSNSYNLIELSRGGELSEQ
jgi:hypothetical protein